MANVTSTTLGSAAATALRLQGKMANVLITTGLYGEPFTPASLLPRCDSRLAFQEYSSVAYLFQ